MAPWEANWQVLASAAVVLVLAWWFAQRRSYVFFIAVTNGTSQVKQGKVAGPFLDQVRTVFQEHSVANAWIGGVRQGRRIRLMFSPSVPAACRQQLRNVWALVGWTPAGISNRQKGRR